MRLPLLLWLWCAPALAADYLFAYPPLQAPRALDPAQQQALAQTGRVRHLDQLGAEGEAWLVQDVPLPRETLWRLLLDFDAYAEQVPALASSRRLDSRTLAGRELVRVDYVARPFLLTLRYRLVHECRPDNAYMRWTLDPAADNSLRRVEGYWLLTPHPRHASWTRAYYGARLTVADWMPGLLNRKLAELGLSSTSDWLTAAPGLAARLDNDDHRS